MNARQATGLCLIEIVVALGISGIVVALAGSLLVTSLAAWRRGRDLREAQIQATTLVDALSRDVTMASQASSITTPPQLHVEQGEPLLAVALPPVTGRKQENVWVVYTFWPGRKEVIREVFLQSSAGPLATQGTRVVAIDVIDVVVEQNGNSVAITAEVRKGRASARSHAVAAPRNP